jgi:hypothetical protein
VVNNKSNKVIVRNGRIVFELNCCRFVFLWRTGDGNSKLYKPNRYYPKKFTQIKGNCEVLMSGFPPVDERCGGLS